MANEKNLIVIYQGSPINMFSDEKDAYVNITDMANACKTRKAILAWIRSKQTIEFLNVWEKKHNPEYDGAQMSTVLQMLKEKNLSIKQWVDLTKAKGILTKTGEFAGTYARRDIAVKFAGWLSPDFELYIIEEIQRLKDLERQKNSFELLNYEQILYLVRLKEVFKFVSHQTLVEDAHKEIFAAKSGNQNPFTEFNSWRNKILQITPTIIDKRIKQYCIENKIALSKKILNKTKRDKILFLDSYDSVKNAVWDFLQMNGEINALNLATLVGNMIRTEKGQVLRENEDTLFTTKQDLGEFSDLKNQLNNSELLQNAKKTLKIRNEIKKRKQSPQLYNEHVKGLIENSTNTNTDII